MKQNVIIYQPGFGGQFLTHLFSLAPTTVPYCSEDQFENGSPITVNDRLTTYVSAQLTDERLKINGFEYYANYHRKLQLSRKQVANQNSIVTSFHPREVILFDQQRSSKSNIQYFIANLSYDPFANFWLVHSKQLWGGWPGVPLEQFQSEDKVRLSFECVPISIDAFLNKDTWLDEYKKINLAMELPNQIDAAILLYDSWYQTRVLPFKKKFKLLDNLEKYLTLRKWTENYGEVHWRRFYNDVRGPDWPDCNFEEGFYQLPIDIQNMLTDFFHYQPKPLL